MTLSIKNDGYAFLIRLDLMFSMSLWKDKANSKFDLRIKEALHIN